METQDKITKIYLEFCVLVRNLVNSGVKIKCCSKDTIKLFINSKHAINKQSRGYVLRSMRMITQYCRDHGDYNLHLDMNRICNQMSDVIRKDTTSAWGYRELVSIDDDPKYNGLTRRDIAKIMIAALFPEENSY